MPVVEKSFKEQRPLQKLFIVLLILFRTFALIAVVGVQFGIGLATDRVLDDVNPLWTNAVFSFFLALQIVLGWSFVKFIANSDSDTSWVVRWAKVIWTALTWGVFKDPKDPKE